MGEVDKATREVYVQSLEARLRVYETLYKKEVEENARLREENAEQIARGLRLAGEVDKLTEALKGYDPHPALHPKPDEQYELVVPGHVIIAGRAVLEEVTPIQTDP